MLIENSSFIIPERKLQSLLCHLAMILCSEDASSSIFESAHSCLQEVWILVGYHSDLFLSSQTSECIQYREYQKIDKQGIQHIP